MESHPAKLRGISIHALREEGDYAKLDYSAQVNVFLSTPSARRATGHSHNCAHVHAISIHALREEGDLKVSPGNTSSVYFYPRPPRGGRRWEKPAESFVTHFYPRPPRGGRR